MAFDILERNGRNLEDWPYWKRKDQLLDLCVSSEDAIRFVPYQKDIGKAWNIILSEELEGLIAKQVESPYEHFRSYKWLKVKNWRFETCKVVGVTAGEGARTPFFGSLVTMKDGQYRGCVGSGFNDWDLRNIKDKLANAEASKPRFPYERVGEHYRPVRAILKILVKYYETTGSGVMRHPVFMMTR